MSRPNNITVACVQHASSNKQQNWQRTTQGIAQAKQQGADIVLLQELHTGDYFPQTQKTDHFDLAQPIPGPDSKQLSMLAKEYEIVLVGSLFEKRAPGLYHNTAVVYERDGSPVGFYRKMHIPDDPGFNEKFYFTPGDTGFEPIQTSVGRLGVLVCWDQWFPEAARIMALKGADLLLYPTAIGWDPTDTPEEQKRQLDAWQLVQRGHAIANGLPLVCCNRIGFEACSEFARGTQFWGNSFICGPQGELLASANEEAQVICAPIDFNHNEKVRQIWPFLRDRRIDAYQSLLKRFD